MDGGAEIYLEYGFARLAVQEYRNSLGASVVLEVFEMKGASAAFGMFTFKSALSGTALSLGRAGQLADYYLNFWKGQWLVTLSGEAQNKATIDGMEGVAASVAGRIRDEADPPRASGFLPEEAMVPWSLKYFLGPLGLRNSYIFSNEDIFQAKECVKADYEGGADLFLFLYPTAEERDAALARLGSAVRDGTRFSGFETIARERLTAKDSKGKPIRVQASDTAILVSVGAQDWKLIERRPGRLRPAGDDPIWDFTKTETRLTSLWIGPGRITLRKTCHEDRSDIL